MNKYLLLSLIIASAFIFSCKKATNNPSGTHPVASFLISTNGYQVSFMNATTGNPTSYSWNFGDASALDTARNPTHTYATSGTYHVVLTATNKAGSDTFGMNVIVYEQVVDIHTRFGDMYLWLYNEMPIYKANYLKNVTTHLYDSTTFHRCVPNFVIQGGDSLSKGADQSLAGTGGPDNLPFIYVKTLTHIYGAVGAASQSAKGPGNNWQFYIVTNKSGDHQLDGNYAVFGYIMSGMNTALTIQSQPQNSANNMPDTPIRMSCTILSETKAQILANYGYTVK